MDRRQNPYTPNAGARPPALVGRRELLDSFEILLARLADGRSEQSMMITGLRGVGKTVLLGAFEDRAQAAKWTTVDAEMTKHSELGQRIAQLSRRALLRIAPRERWGARMKQAASVLTSFSLTFDPSQQIFGLSANPAQGWADSGVLDDDLTDLFIALGDAAREQETGVVFLLDEVQYLEATELEALIGALHKTVQEQLPITLVGAGLPQLPRLAGEAKSYAERLFRFPTIGDLSDEEATAALAQPAVELGVSYEPDAVAAIVSYTEGYPYFIQEYGKLVWDLAPQAKPIGLDVVNEARPLVEQHLDESFFRVRADRTTDLELQYLRAMAKLGRGPHRTGDVADAMSRTSKQVGPTRARLIAKGLLYTPGYGVTAFTVPQFDRYMTRTHPESIIKPPKTRRGPS